MGGVHAVLEFLRHRRALRSRSTHPTVGQRPVSEPVAEGMLYLTPSGEGYVLYAATGAGSHTDRQAA